MIEVNKIYNENANDVMAMMPDKLVDLVVTSPPYDNLRDYEGRMREIWFTIHSPALAQP